MRSASTNLKIQESGFVAMLVVVVLSAVVLAVVLSISYASVAFRVNALAGEFKSVSASFAEACVQLAIGKIVNNPAYVSAVEQVSFGDITCKIVSVSRVGDDYTVRTQSVYPVGSAGGAYTNLQVVFSLRNDSIMITSRKELPSS